MGLVTITTYGTCYYAYGVLIEPIRSDTGWSLTALGAVFSIILALNGVLGIVGGRLTDRAGTRLPFALAGTLGAGAMFVASYQHSLAGFAVFYAGGCGIVGALAYYHVTQASAARLHSTDPGRAIVWLTIFGAFASPIFLPLTAQLVDLTSWRATIRFEAAIVGGVLLLAALLSNTDGSPSAAEPAGGLRAGIADAFRSKRLRVWVAASLVSGAATDVLLAFQVPAMTAAGLPLAIAATVAGVRGFAQLGGRAPLGPILGRLGNRRTLIAADLVAALAAVLLLMSGHLAIAVAYSLLAGASLGAISTLQGIYTHELVEPGHLSVLLGVQQAIFGLGGAVGPIAAGALIDGSGSYTGALLGTMAAFVFSAGLLLRA